MARSLISAFNAGVLSPLLDARVDIEKYRNGCRILENCVPKIYGGAFGRAGMAYMGAAKHADKKVRLIEFIFSASTNFILEFGDEYVRFWSNGVQVESSPGVPLEIASVFGEADLFFIQYIQINDVMYLVDGTHAVQKLTRLTDTSWTIAPVEWKFPALKDENISTTTLAASATSGSVAITASTAIFDADMVGGYFQIAHRRDTSHLELALTATGDSSELRVLGRYDIFTYGTWSGTLLFQRKNDLGTWETVRSWESENDKNVSVSGDATEEETYRFSYTRVGSTGTPRAVLESADSRIYGLVKVTGYTDTTHVTATVVKTLHNTSATLLWSEGAWSDHQGHPRTVTLHEQTLVFGGCERQPLTLWGSVLGDFENFQRSSLADGAWAHLIGSTRGNAIVWLASKEGLVVGTQGDEWLVTGEGDARLSATSVSIKRQSAYGSAYMQPCLGNDAVMFVQRGRRKLREFVYVFEKDGYTAPDLTLLAEHIAGDGFKQLAFASTPDPVVWAVTEDGQLLSMTFERDQSVVGWSVHTTGDGDEVESVAVIYGDTGEADEVWLVVKRTIKEPVTFADVTRRYIERLDPRKWVKLEESDFEDMIYSDSALVIEMDPAATLVSGLEHLEGRTVSVLADGFVHAQRNVNNGVIYLQDAASKVVVGLPFVPRIQPTRTDIQLQDGTAQGRTWKCSKATIRLWKSLGCQYADSPTSSFNHVDIREVSTPLTDQQALFTGDKDVTLASTHRTGLDITLRQTLPLPFHVLAIMPVFDVSGQ